jgi:hypothetical protein
MIWRAPWHVGIQAVRCRLHAYSKAAFRPPHGVRCALPPCRVPESPRHGGRRRSGKLVGFPMLVRRTLWHGLYDGVGYAPRVISGRAHFISAKSFFPPAVVYQECFLPGSWDTTHGVVAEGGIERRAGAAQYRARDPLYPLEPARAEYPVAARPVCRLAGGPGRCALRDHLPRTTIATLIPSYSCLTTAQPRTIKYDRHRGHMPADRSIGVSIGEGMFTRRKP